MTLMLDPTLSDAAILRSVRKFFIDEFKTVEGVPLYFEFIDKQPTDAEGNKIDRWMCVIPRNPVRGTLSTKYFHIYLFTSGDTDGYKLAEFRDTVYEKLVDFSHTDCKKRVACYDSSWTQQFVAVIKVLDDMNFDLYTEGINLKILPFLLNWGAK